MGETKREGLITVFLTFKFNSTFISFLKPWFKVESPHLVYFTLNAMANYKNFRQIPMYFVALLSFSVLKH